MSLDHQHDPIFLKLLHFQQLQNEDLVVQVLTNSGAIFHGRITELNSEIVSLAAPEGPDPNPNIGILTLRLYDLTGVMLIRMPRKTEEPPRPTRPSRPVPWG